MDEFNSLDAMLSSMQATSTYLTQQLANLPGISGTSKSG
jgi:flagellar capping protein FliD